MKKNKKIHRKQNPQTSPSKSSPYPVSPSPDPATLSTPLSKKDSWFHNITKGLCPGGSTKRERKSKREGGISEHKKREEK
jgi:hypothetical protein